jgi:hypothetical protein
MASIIKADNIQKVSDGTNIIKKCGSTITLGSCGATIALACGATQTGFGQSYSAVEYCTTAKTSPFTAAAGTGYFVNTTCGAVTVTLPASPTAGDVVAFKDYASQWNTNAVTLCNNGNKINGVCATASLSTQNQSVTLIYVDATKGWQDIQDSTAGVSGAAYITATGGTITTSGDYKIHTFTSDGTFSVSAGGGPLAVVDYLVVAGGGSGGGDDLGGGGGGGGFRASSTTYTIGCGPAAPLTACVSALPVSVLAYPITVGAGGAGVNGAAQGNPGSNSVFSTITSTGGGGAGGGNSIFPYGPGRFGLPGGSGGGGGFWQCGPIATGGTGNTPPVSPSQGNSGGTTSPPGARGGGGGGAIAVGSNGTGSVGGAGGVGAGIPNAMGTSGENCGAYYYFSGGGGGSGDCSPFANGAIGGGGDAGPSGPGASGNGVAGTANTGGGGGGAGGLGAVGNLGAAGGSGIVIIRYKFQ